MKKYIIALDEGTTSARAIIFDKQFNIVSVAQHEFTQIYPQPGWVEHDPMEIFASEYSALTESIAKSGIPPKEIACIGITNQRETTIVWDKYTGMPIYNAIVWQCRRTKDICNKLISDGYSSYITETTGLKPDAYFSATKIKWILDNVKGAREKAEKGELLFGTVDTWLCYKLTNGKVFVTDRTNASRTMLYNLKTGDWDDKLLKILDIPRSMLPEIKSSSEIYGYVDIFGEYIPISGIAGDQQSSLFGQGCFSEGDTKITYGTGCFLLTSTKQNLVYSKSGLITTATATLKGQPFEYALEGSVFVGGAVIQWLRDEMRFITESKDSEYFASKVPDTNGVYVVPAFAGLGAPYWDMDARGIIVGITRGTTRNHIIRASLEAIAYECNDVIDAISKDIGKKPQIIKADGGASNNSILMQFQADISNVTVACSVISEATALGACMLAGLGVNFYSSREEIANLIKKKTVFKPNMQESERKIHISGWQKAIKQCSCKE